MRDREFQGIELDGEVVSEEDAAYEDADASGVTVLARAAGDAALPVLREEARTAAIAVAGGALAGAATVAAVRAVGSTARGGRGSRRLGRRNRKDNIVATRSFLVDVHFLGR